MKSVYFNSRTRKINLRNSIIQISKRLLTITFQISPIERFRTFRTRIWKFETRGKEKKGFFLSETAPRNLNRTMLINLPILQWGTTWVAFPRAARGTRSTGRGRQVGRNRTAYIRVTSTRSRGNLCSWSSTRTTASYSSRYLVTSASR